MVAILLQGVPVITVGISTVFFREMFPAVTYAGIAIIIAGTVLATLAAEPGRKRMGLRAIVTVTPALLAVSISYSLQSYTLRTISVDTLFVAGRVGQLAVAAGLLCLAPIRRDLVATTARLSRGVMAIVVLVGLLNLLGVYLLNEAYARGPLALVTTLSSIQPVLVLALILVVNSIRPHTVPDEGSRRYLGPRAVATGLVIAGIFLSSS